LREDVRTVLFSEDCVPHKKEEGDSVN